MNIILLLILINAVKGQVNYKGDILNYLWEEKIIWLIGNAEVKTLEITTKADTIKYEAKKGMVTATGNPILWVGSQKIVGEKMRYNLDTGEGIVQNGRTQIKKGWFDGEIITKVGTDVLNINRGRFTTCDLNSPHYYFWGKELKVYIDDMIYTRPLVFFVQDIPLFITPFWWFPIKSGRQSGLLHPKIGRSSDKGRYVENLAYYLVTNSWSDATFTFNYYEMKGPRFNLEGRWVLSQNAKGNFNSSYIAEQSPNEEARRKRWTIDCEHSQNFDSRLSLRAKGNFVSDGSVKVDYEDERLVQLDKTLNSYLSVSKAWDLGTMNFVLEERRDLDTDSIQRWFPKASYGLNSINIFGGYFSCNGAFTNSNTSEEYEQSAYNNFGLSLPFKLFKHITVAPATNHTFAYNNPDTLKYPEHLLKPRNSNYSVSVSTNLYGRSVFTPEFRHTIRPRISYSHSHSNYFTNTARSCGFSVGNDFQLVLGEKKFNLATLNLGSSWDFGKDSLNPVSISMRSSAIPLLNLETRWTYKPYVKILKFEQLMLSSYFSKKEFSANASYSWTPRDDWSSDQSLRFGLKTKLTENWKLGFSGMYDFLDNKLIDQNFSLTRDLHCWEAVFNFNSYADNWRYDFKLRLKEIPEIKLGKAIFGLFL